MKILFLHPNFPAQFRHLATVLGADSNHQVAYITARAEGQIPGVQKFLYKVTREVSPETHRYVRPLEDAVATGQAAWRTAHQLKTQLSFVPDVIYAHVGWGPGLFVRDLFPEARYIGFFEWYYQAKNSDVDFDPSHPVNDDEVARVQIQNAPILLELVRCDLGVVPTQWQKQQFPPEFHHKLHVLHDGIDIMACQPKPGAKLVLPPLPAELMDAQVSSSPAKSSTQKSSTQSPSSSKNRGFGQKADSTGQSKGWAKGTPKGDARSEMQSVPPLSLGATGLDLANTTEIITYVARGMEPHRGFPQLMAAVERLQQMRPQCHVVIVGEDRVAYGLKRSDGRTYREKALEELKLDLSRIHFTGLLPYGYLRQVYQASSVHLYLTYPFVLSWSMLEAMASGCVVLGSKTPPVEEVIRDGENGFLVDFWNVDAIATRLNQLLEDQANLGSIRQQARQTIVDRYDLAKLMPKQLSFLTGEAAEAG